MSQPPKISLKEKAIIIFKIQFLGYFVWAIFAFFSLVTFDKTKINRIVTLNGGFYDVDFENKE